jgi:hypothetical protein
MWYLMNLSAGSHRAFCPRCCKSLIILLSNSVLGPHCAHLDMPYAVVSFEKPFWSLQRFRFS